MGSILVGSEADIARARRARKLFGGALRQAGMVAAAAVYALENNIERLAVDHANAKLLADSLATIDGIVLDPNDVETNLVFFSVEAELGNAGQLSAKLKEQGIGINACGPQKLRACTHLDIDEAATLKTVEVIRGCMAEGFSDFQGSLTGPYCRA